MHIKTKVISIIVISSILLACANQIDDSNIQPDQVVYTDLDASLDSGKPVVIYFNEAYCSNCKDQRPIINGIISASDNKTAVVVLDRTENKDVAQKYGIEIAPNMVILDGDGRVIKTGYTGHDELNVLIDDL